MADAFIQAAMAEPYDGVSLMVDLSKEVRVKFWPDFLLSHAPQTPYLTIPPGTDPKDPKYYGSYLAILSRLGGLGDSKTVNFFNVQAYNNPGYEGCSDTPENAPSILNNLVGDSPTQPSPLPAIWGGFTTPKVEAKTLLFGQLIPEVPPTRPHCDGAMTPEYGMQFWLDAPENTVAPNGGADEVVRQWYPPAPSERSPSVKVVYYLNHPIDLSGYGTWSPCNVIILGFVYPALNGGGLMPAPHGTSDLPPWASFGLYYNFGLEGKYVDYTPQVNPLKLADQGFAAALKKWRAVEPGKRKIMIGLGGYAYTPLYSLWAKSRDNMKIVAKGLHRFFEQFKAANDFGLDGLDLDYEDSKNLFPYPRAAPAPATAPTSAAALAVRGPGRLSRRAYKSPMVVSITETSSSGPSYPLLIVVCVLVVVVLAVCIATCVLAARR